ncbi:hypothetical protein MKX03_017400 [Papaver bracteatum]|nr:hypothetical protein MKX03_017400 [Papaver bracteatum]
MSCCGSCGTCCGGCKLYPDHDESSNTDQSFIFGVVPQTLDIKINSVNCDDDDKIFRITYFNFIYY